MPTRLKWLERFRYLNWVLLLLLLPITSMPFMVRLVRSDTVAAPSGIFLSILFVIWLIPFFVKRGKIPKSSIPLFVFTGIAIIATLIAQFYDLPAYKNHTSINESLTSFITLGIGLSFYFVTVTIIQDEQQLKNTLKWISIAGLLIIFWSIAQAVSWMAINRYPQWMKVIHDVYSVGPLFRQRVSGFALEPSWLAHQLNVLFIPYWLGATLTKSTVFRLKVWKFTVENLLLVLAMMVLLLTYSRIGLAAVLVMLAIPIIRIALGLLQKFNLRIFNKLNFHSSHRIIQILVRVAWFTFLVILALGVVLGLGYLLSKLDYRMRSLFEFDFQHRDAILNYAEKLSLAARFVYWDAGWGVFDKFPWLGTGLGNSGFYFPETLNPYAWKLTEVRMLLYRTEVLLNPKSLWIRILAETGIIGFSAFLAWLYAIAKTIPAMLHNQKPLMGAMGWMGIFVLVGLVFEGFSLDTFGLPYYWIALGLISCIFVTLSQKTNIDKPLDAPDLN